MFFLPPQFKKGVLHLKNNPGQSWQKFSTNHPELTSLLNKKILFMTLKYFANDPAKLNKKRYQVLTKFLWNKGAIKFIPKLEDYAVELR